MEKLTPEDLAQLDRDKIASLTKNGVVNLSMRLIDLCIELYEKVNQDSSNSSMPPSSDNPFKRGKKKTNDAHCQEQVDEPCSEGSGENSKDDPDEPKKDDLIKAGTYGEETEKRKPGKQMGAQGFGRTQNAKPEDTIEHYPKKCVVCSCDLEKPLYLSAYTGYYTYELEKDDHQIRIVCILHRYHYIVCQCGHENMARPGEGVISVEEGRKQNLKLTENRLIGPKLATFIAALNREYRMSRKKIRQYLIEWFDFKISDGTICNCIREAGIACYPIVDQLVEELQQEEQVHVDETPWYQKGVFLWLWVAVSNTVVIYLIGSRKKEVLLSLITEAFFGWLITDGYASYRFYEKRQRCLAHLIRKAIALTGAVDQNARKMGDWFLREIRGLIAAMAEGENGKKKCGPILARLKKACNSGSKADHAKLKAFAKEILNDWDAVVAFVKNPQLPATNNEAERALRMAVIYRKICYGTRTEEGSRSYASFLSVMETCKRRGINPWDYIGKVIACARKGINPPPMQAV